MRSACLLIAVCLAFAGAANAQNITVQQPAISTFSVNTTVSAPDGGGLMLGGAASASRAGARYGLPRLGSTAGVVGVGGTMTVHPTIHDLEELDRQTLAAARKQLRREEAALPANAEAAWSALARRGAAEGRATAQGARLAGAKPAAPTSPARVAQLADSRDDQQQALHAARLLKLGQRAEADGKPEVALSFYRAAAKSGSREAQQLLPRLRSPRL